MIRRFLLVLALAAVAVGVVPHASAQRDPPIRVSVLVVLARETAGPIDPSLRNEPALRRPPFNSFHSMEVIARPTGQLTARAPVLVNLPNGRRLQVALVQRLPNGQVRIAVSINRPGQRDYLPVMQVDASPGDPFFVAGQSHAGGTLIIGVRVGERVVRAIVGPAQQGVQINANPGARPVVPGAVVQPAAPAPTTATQPARPGVRAGVRVRANVQADVPEKRPSPR